MKPETADKLVGEVVGCVENTKIDDVWIDQEDATVLASLVTIDETKDELGKLIEDNTQLTYIEGFEQNHEISVLTFK